VPPRVLTLSIPPGTIVTHRAERSKPWIIAHRVMKNAVMARRIRGGASRGGVSTDGRSCQWGARFALRRLPPNMLFLANDEWSHREAKERPSEVIVTCCEQKEHPATGRVLSI
jgi:hypothetical protein